MLRITYLDPHKLDHYARLGVGRNATRREIELAYRRASRTAHPDAGGDPATWLLLQEAYATLTNTGQRYAYDTLGMTAREVEEATQVLLEGILQAYMQGCDTQQAVQEFLDGLLTQQLKQMQTNFKQIDKNIKTLYKFLGEVVETDNWIMTRTVEAARSRLAMLGDTRTRQETQKTLFENALKLIPHVNLKTQEPPPPPTPPVFYQTVRTAHHMWNIGGFPGSNSTRG